MTTGQLIRAARKKAGMTQSELAQKLNIPFQSVSQWERDLRNPKHETLRRIADALGVSWEDLYVFSIEAEQERKLDEIEEIKKQLNTTEGKERAELEYALEVLTESYKDVALLDALQRGTREELTPGAQQGAVIASDVIKRAGLTLKSKDGKVIHQGDGKPWVRVFPTPKERIDAALEQMTPEGQDRVADYAEDILPRYQATTPTPQEGSGAPETPPE